MEQNRWRSPVLWTAIAAQVLALVALTGLDKALGIDTGMVGDVVAGVLQILVLIGVLNNPTDRANF